MSNFPGILNLIKPRQGYKIIIEGDTQKSGKTLLMVMMITHYLKIRPRSFVYANMRITNPRCVLKKTLTKADLQREGYNEYIVALDEFDLCFPWQKSFDNEGMWAFFGHGASHNSTAVIATVQNFYKELRNKLKVNIHIRCKRTLFNSKTEKPFAVVGEILYPKQQQFLQIITPVVGQYDPYEADVERIVFREFVPENRDRADDINKETIPKMNRKRAKAFHKLMEWAIKEAGGAAFLSMEAGISKSFIYNFKQQCEHDGIGE